MRLAAIYDHKTSAHYYRAVFPMRALARRHTTTLPQGDAGGQLPLAALTGCDALLTYRLASLQVPRLIDRLHERGIGVVYDNDDDLRNVPSGRAGFGTPRERKELWAHHLAAARLADVVTVTTDILADRLREAGVPEVRVIDNYLHPGKVQRKTRRHDGIVIGWIAGAEHVVDARELRMSETLRELQARRPEVHVECVGIDLGLKDRYRRTINIPFDRLPDTMAGWDIGIAPIGSHAFNATRSSIKVKEYAASQVPWLASAAGPYLGLGENEGGRLVADDEWLDALDTLVADAKARKRLSKNGAKWAKRQTTDIAAGHLWEAALTDASERALARTQARARVPA